MKGKMQSFLMSSANQQEVAALDQKVRCARVYICVVMTPGMKSVFVMDGGPCT